MLYFGTLPLPGNVLSHGGRKILWVCGALFEFCVYLALTHFLERLSNGLGWKTKKYDQEFAFSGFTSHQVAMSIQTGHI